MLFILSIIIYFLSAVVGEHSVSGVVFSQETEAPLNEAHVLLYQFESSEIFRVTVTNHDGKFRFDNIPSGNYRILVSYLGFKSESHSFTLSSDDVVELKFDLVKDKFELGELYVDSNISSMEVHGDTIIFNADYYNTTANAVLKDLILRMPGFEVNDGFIQAQGQTVIRILVDGEDFFGDETAIALRNLPVSVIHQVQVFDRPSEYSRFTGVNDGKKQRTINIITSDGLSHGYFGRVSGSLGTQNRYLGEGSVNYFKGARRISVISLSNNINQTDFSPEEIGGASEASAGDGIGNFFMGSQYGINQVHSFGINYIDRWNDRWKVNGNYFLNASDNRNNQVLQRNYLHGDQDGQIYTEESISSADNFNHQFNSRLEYRINDQRSIQIKTSANILLLETDGFFDGKTIPTNLTGDPFSDVLNRSSNLSASNQLSYDFNSSLLYSHRFNKVGRTVLVDFQGATSRRDGNQQQAGEIYFYDLTEQIIFNNQTSDIENNSNSLLLHAIYTEPLSKKSHLFIGYHPKFQKYNFDRATYMTDYENNSGEHLDERFSNRYKNTTKIHSLRSGYLFQGNKYRFGFNINAEYSLLEGEQIFPAERTIDKQYFKFLPGLQYRYRITDRSNISLNYSTQTRNPHVSQLQDFIDNSNPLQLRGGNPDLEQEFTHSLNFRYSSYQPKSGRTFSGFVTLNYISNYIGYRTFISDSETELSNGMNMGKGARLVYPANTGKSRSIRTFLNYSHPISFLSGNFNLNTGVLLRQYPLFVNLEQNTSTTTTFNSGLSFNSNITGNVDFFLRYNAAYTIVDNSNQSDINQNVFSGTGSFSFEITPWKGFVLVSDLTLRQLSAVRQSINNDIYFWNGGVGYRFLNDQTAEIRFTVVDILGQNRNMDRIISDTYIEKLQSMALSRFLKVTFFWNFREI